jgi:hypothetical protein
MVWQRTAYVYKLLGNYTLVRNLTDEIGTVSSYGAGMPVSISGNGSTGELRLEPLTMPKPSPTVHRYALDPHYRPD